jgi:hypothetical protein
LLKVQVQYQFRSHRIFGVRSGTGRDFSPNTSVTPPDLVQPIAPYLLIFFHRRYSHDTKSVNKIE